MYIWNEHVKEIYTADSIYKRIQICFIKPQWRLPYFIWRQIYIFVNQNVYNIRETTCYSCAYLIIINSEMIFIVFSANCFQVIFEK
jgi:hypothetical protein